jgi:hypothetical protein
VASVSEIPAAPDVLGAEVQVLALPEVAVRLRQPVSRVRQMVRDGRLLALRRDGVVSVPVDFLSGDDVVKGLPGTVTVLRDGGYSHEAILRWLFTDDATLPGTPIAALRSDRAREVKRRAQAMAF